MTTDLTGDEEIRVLLNSNVKMSRGKAAAQAIHAVLIAYGIPHGRVVVLGGSPAEIAEMPATVRDAGLTEVEPGTLTAGARVKGQEPTQPPDPGPRFTCTRCDLTNATTQHICFKPFPSEMPLHKYPRRWWSR